MKPEEITAYMSDCTLCPRHCHADRSAGKAGYCGAGAALSAARAALHFWEEPCISGTAGSGAIFFSGCNLKCVFCQNHSIAAGLTGRDISVGRLCDLFFELEQKGAVNINLVTAGHFLPQVVCALELAGQKGLSIPVVYNTGSYEEVSSLRLLEGLVDIWLPDLKYVSPELSAKYSFAPDYFEKASAAIAEMVRQAGPPQIDEATGLMKRGVIVRHLVLPGQVKDSKKVLRYLHETYGNQIYISIMNQYTPLPHVEGIPELNRRVTAEEYDRVVRFAERLGIVQGFIQEGETAKESFIPDFNCEGL